MFQWLSVFKVFNGFNDFISFNCYNNFNRFKGFNGCIWSLLKQINKNSNHTLTWLFYTHNRYLNMHFKYFHQQTTKSIRFDVKYISAKNQVSLGRSFSPLVGESLPSTLSPLKSFQTFFSLYMANKLVILGSPVTTY